MARGAYAALAEPASLVADALQQRCPTGTAAARRGRGALRRAVERSAAMTNGIEDRVGDESAGDSYFDPGEFELRAHIEDEHYWHVHRRRLLLDELRRACPDESRQLIELGCGIGTVTTYLNLHGYRVDYADVHTAGLRLARERAERRLGALVEQHRFFRLDITRDFPEGHYDGALLLDVLEHLPNDVATLRNVGDHLRERSSGAFVLFTVPAFSLLWSPWDDIEKHVRRYAPDEARSLAERAGLRVERVSCFFFPLFFAALGVKILRTARGVLKPVKAPERITDLTETKSPPWLTRTALNVLGPERKWLHGDRTLPIGTSVVCVARV